MKAKVIVTIVLSLVIIVIGVTFGSVWVPPDTVWHIIRNKVFSVPLPESVSQTSVAIVWNLRLPRALLAFIVGACLSISGAVMQSVLRNPLASSYTLGVSSGASLGACIVIMFGVTLPFLPLMTLPLIGFAFGLGTILLAVAFASRLDGQMENNTIILTGMVFSLFVNALTTLLSAISREHLQRLVFWQMGSFSARGWTPVAILAPIIVAGLLYVLHYNRELDMMTFGEEQAKTMGVNIKRIKWILLVTSAALTGSAIAFVGVIGFVDLVAPHIIRRIFGSSHRYVLPMSAFFGGAFMVICDLVARTVVSPAELPVGAVTAMIGAPFFAYIYFGRKNKA
ncbi:MAG: iron ABC transporter permease [Oscillospiraceae bacterium]|nr:iron ABC transporter permease [Oscillospiraceae bacterium]